MNAERMIEVCNLIAQDVENDAKNFDGAPFTGKTVAEYFGNHGAAIKSLAEMLGELLQNTTNKNHETTT